METYISRVCWNSEGWQHPTGEARLLETGSSYVAENGFGHEEWLFDFSKVIDGYHCAYLQPVGRSRARLEGQTIHVLLYSINSNSERVYVGEIDNCEVLTEQQSAIAYQHYKRAGWLKDMRDSVVAVEGNSGLIEKEQPAKNLFNVRFRLRDGHRYEYPRVAKASDIVMSYNRYILIAAGQTEVSNWRREQGRTPNPSIQVISRKGTLATTYDPAHKRMQAELLPILQKQFGKESVKYEEQNVDLMVQTPDRTILIEVKTHANAREAIREALGQILEYAFFKSPISRIEPELVIIAPAAMRTEVQAYLDLLQRKFRLKLRYLQFNLGGTLEEL